MHHPQRKDFRFIHRLQVRWAEIDLQGVVFNGHYLLYFDTAMSARWKSMGLAYSMLPQQLGGDLYVKKSELTYHSPARLDDSVDIGIRLEAVGRSSITIATAMFVQDRLVLSGRVVYVYTDRGRPPRPQAVPPALRDLLQDYERGAEMFRVEAGSWSQFQAESRAIRQAVFVLEQGIPAELEWDDADAGSLHFVLRNRMGLAIGCARLLPDGHIGRVAVLQPLRSGGAGRALMRGAMAAAREQGHAQVELSAQLAVAGFYRSFGFEAVGEPYEDAGIPHQLMRLRFVPGAQGSGSSV